MEFLLALGWPVNVHATWKRNAKPEPGQLDFGGDNPGASLYNGEKCVLYWADVTSEVAFVVPTDKSCSDASVWNTMGYSSSEHLYFKEYFKK